MDFDFEPEHDITIIHRGILLNFRYDAAVWLLCGCHFSILRNIGHMCKGYRYFL